MGDLELIDVVLEDEPIEVTSITVTETEQTESTYTPPADVSDDTDQTDVTDDSSGESAVLSDYDFQLIYDLIDEKFLSIIENQDNVIKNHKTFLENQDSIIKTYDMIIENQESVITLLQEQNNYISEMHSVLVNFFFCFMVLMVCKFVHFLFYKVFFGGIT